MPSSRLPHAPGALLLTLLLLACPGPSAPIAAEPAEPEGGPPPAHRVFPSAAAAVAFVMEAKPRVIGIGEVHATTDGPVGTTTLARFTATVLPVLAPSTSDLVIETWRVDSRCGEQAEQVVAQVETDTRRPEATKSELVLLIEAAVSQDVRPHDLAISCAEYATLTGPDGNIAYDRLLRLLTVKLGEYVQQGLGTPDATVVLYGGAIHNDVLPKDGYADYSYGVAARARGGAAYVELDLYAPELVRGNPALIEPGWAPLLDLTGPDRALLYERGPGSWVLLLEAQGPARSMK